MYQRIIIVGNLGKDPEARFTPGGQQVTSFSVATENRYNNAAGEQVKETCWFRVSTWGKQAEICNQYLKKGSKVLVEGRLTPDKATGGPRVYESNGKHGSSYDLRADTVRFLSPRTDGDQSAPVAVDDDSMPF